MTTVELLALCKQLITNDDEFLCMFHRDKQKELSRKRKLEVYQSTGTWPDRNRKLKKSITTESSWSIAKDKRTKKQNKKAKREAHQNKGLSDAEVLSMEKAFSQEAELC